MNVRTFALAAVAVCTFGAAHAEEGIAFDVKVLRGDQLVGSPRMVGHFGQPIAVEVSRQYRLEALAQPPNGEGHALTSVKFQLLGDMPAAAPHEMRVLADLRRDTSVQYMVPGTDVRLVIVERRVEVPR